MKKIISAVTAVFSIAILFLAVSCHDPIFYMISQEVVQEKGLEGDVKSLVKFKGKLYLSNGKIFQKSATPSDETGQLNGQWEASSMSGMEGFVVFLATDGSYLYAQTYQFKPDDDKSLNLVSNISLYASTDAQTWTEVDITSFGRGAARIFDNGGSAAYIGVKQPTEEGDPVSHLYKLNGTNVPSEYNSAPGDSLGAAGDQFWKTPALCKVNDMYYFSMNSKILYYGSNTTDTLPTEEDKTPAGSSIRMVQLDCEEIQSIAATSDYLLLGTRKGLEKVKLLEGGIPDSKTTDFANNAQSLVTGIVTMVFVLDPSKPEGQTDEYAAMEVAGSLSSSQDTFDENGLYAYYPSRGVWNRDGE